MRSRKAATSLLGWASFPSKSQPATAPSSAKYRNAEHKRLQSKAGYIDARPHIRQLGEIFLQRTAGPYIGSRAAVQATLALSPLCPRYCCKSLSALVIKNSPGCRRDFRVKMWGASSPEDKLTGDLGNAFEAAEIGGRWSDRLLAGKLSSGDFGLLQQYPLLSGNPRRRSSLPSCLPDSCGAAKTFARYL